MDRVAQVRTSRRSLLNTSLGAAAAAMAAPIAGRLPAAPVSATPVTPATPGADGDPDALFAELDDLIVTRMAELKIPGVAVGVIAGDREHAAGFGVTNVDHPRPVETDTLFQIGSTTKTFTGTAVMRLVEQGALDLEAPVRTYLPDFKVADPGVSREVRVRHLVTHTAGWLDGGDPETGDGDDALARYVGRMASMPQIAPLGTYFSYNNSAVCLAGHVIEAVTGQTYESAITTLVLQPLGLTQTFYFPEEIMNDAFAVGHIVPSDNPQGEPVVVEPWGLPRAYYPAGGLVTSVRDDLRYARFHLGDGTADGRRVLSAASMHRMQSPLGPEGSVPSLGSHLDGVGVNWLLWRRGGERIVSHAGGTTGQQSTFTLVPGRGFAVTVLTNAATGVQFGNEVTDWALERFLALPRPPVTTVAADPARLAEYAGAYALPDGSEPIQIGEVDGALHLAWLVPSFLDPAQPRVELPLRLTGEDQAIVDFMGLPVFVDFVRDDAGMVAWIRFVGRLVPRVR